MKIKKLAVLFAALIGLTACGAQPELMAFVKEGPAEIDFEGMKFVIGDTGSAGGWCVLLPDSGSVPSARMEKLFARYDEFGELYNCEVEVVSFNGEMATRKRGSGDPYVDIMNLRLKDVIDYWKSDYVLPLNEISGIDLYGGKYGTELILDALTWHGDTLGFFPMYWGVMTPNFCDAVYFNPEVFTMINCPNPHELYESGSWNWDALSDIGVACASISTADKPVYLSTLNNYFARMMVLGNGGQYVKESADGNLSYGLLEDNVFAALEKAHEFYTQGYLLEYPGGVSEALELFISNQIALVAEYSVQGIFADRGEIGTKMQGAYGWIYNPEGPAGCDETVGLVSNENQYLFVTRDKEIEMDALSFFLETILEPLGDEPMDWVDEFYNMNFYDEFSFEVFINKFENTVFDKVVFAYTDDTVYDKLLNAAKNGNIRESLESIETSFNARLDQKYNK